MEKELFEELLHLHEQFEIKEWDTLNPSSCESKNIEFNLNNKLSQLDEMLLRMYIVRLKENRFGKIYHKFRKTLLWIMQHLESKNYPSQNCANMEQGIALLENFLEKLDLRFAEFLLPEDFLTKIQLKSLQENVNQFEQNLLNTLEESSKETIEFLISTLHEKIQSSPNYKTQVEINKLIHGYSNKKNLIDAPPFFNQLDSMLISIDFLPEQYRKKLAEKVYQGLAKTTKEQQSPQLASLRAYLKIINEFSGINAAEEQQTIHFLSNLIDHIESSIHFSPTQDNKLSPQKESEIQNLEPYKITCNLSADQLALIIRAMDDSRLLNAKSMNAIFRHLIPFLKTAHRENLSYKAVRSKAYSPEQHDREESMKALEKMIEKIKGY